MNKQELLKEICNKLDYWCEQYKIANDNKSQRFLDAWKTTASIQKAEEAVKYDGECERISKNIKDLESMYNTAKNLF